MYPAVPDAANGLGLFDAFGGGNDFRAMDNFSVPRSQRSLALLASGLEGGLAALRRRIR